MAKKGFLSREAAWDAIRKLGPFGADMIPYQHTDPVTHQKKWFILRKPRKTTHSDNPTATPPGLSERL